MTDAPFTETHRATQMVEVVFKDVGPRKLSWTAMLKHPLTYGALFKEVKKRKALMSQDIDFADNGGIYVGFMRRVGSWERRETP